MGSEQRKNPRIEVNAYVDYTGADVLLYHKIENISLGGMCIQAATPEEPGSIVDLVINFPEFDESIEVAGEVVWVNRDPPHEMGIRFLEVDVRVQSVLENFLAKSRKK
jgi:uncharacterized protein (TIGR02266 family)